MDTTNTLLTTEELESPKKPTVKPNDEYDTRPKSTNGQSTQQTCCEIFKNWKIEHSSFYFFAIFVGICSLICLGIQIFSYLSFRETKREILSIYQPDIRVETRIRDSIFYHDIDSLISPLCTTVERKLNLHGLIDKSVQFAIKQVDCDSLVNHKVKILQQDTKTLLDLHYHKIEHEFQIVQVWCGILTVVFLIFSFYSLFKADDLVKQGKEGLVRLDNIEERGESKINGFHTKCNEALQAFSKRSESKMQEIDYKNQQRINKINDIIQKSQTSTQTYVDDVKKDIKAYQDTIIKECKDILDIDRQQNDNSVKSISRLDAIVNLLQQQSDALEARIKIIEERIK